jgi:hypothetical protein
MLSRVALIALTGLFAAAPQDNGSNVARPDRVVAIRVPQNPLITVKSSPSLGDNVNGPSVIRVPPWVKAPLGRYYMYFAHHYGRFIRLAYADSITGPWKIYEPGVLPIEQTGFTRAQPDPPTTGASQRMHVASPDVHIDTGGRKILMWVHGWWTNGEAWPNTDPKSAYAWTLEKGYGQYTQGVTSGDGIHFESHKPITRTSYLRVFRLEETYYGVGRLGLLARSRQPLGEFELGRNPFGETDYRNRVRHVALVRLGTRLHVFFSAIGDAPERILMSTIDLRGGWESWKASPPVDVLQPERDYECVNLPNEPSRAGEIAGPARQLRDPAVLEEDGRVWLFYTVCGEQGIAVAEVTLPKG